jgi:hypothetical protein
VGITLLMAGLDFFSSLARCARDRRDRIDATAAFSIRPGIGGHDAASGRNLLYKGRATLQKDQLMPGYSKP